MLKGKSVAVVIPAYNEEKQISMVIETMPSFVDRLIIINDCSSDRTEELVLDFLDSVHNESNLRLEGKPIKETSYNKANQLLEQINKRELSYFSPSVIRNKNPANDRIILISNNKNTGVGGSIARGYKWCKDYGIDCVAVMAGDGQMDPDELESICLPVIEENIDYVKGNRLIHRSSWLVIPKARFLGNSILSALTKLASGYWHVSDTQTGYTAISKKALNSIYIHKIYKSYGMPNDMLVRLNIAFCTIKEVEIKPVYNIGEKSKMKLIKVIPSISLLLIGLFFKRLWIKYLFRDFHPLFILYHLSFVLLGVAIPFMIKVIKTTINGIDLNPVTVLAFLFLFISGFQSILFAMWMDIQDNERLYKHD